MKSVKLMLVLVCVGLIVAGCVSKGFVREEIDKTTTQLNIEHAKNLDTKVTELNNDLSKQIVEIKKNYVLNKELDSKLYEYDQEIKKVIETKIEELNVIVQALQQKIETFKVANQDDIIQLSNELKIAASVLWKKLKAERDGLERAMNELDKLDFTKTAKPPDLLVEPPEAPPELPPEILEGE